jgi:iron complex outermembrane receptor protein
MTQHAFRLNAIAALCACWPLLAAAEEPATGPAIAAQGPMNVVVVTGSRSEQNSSDLPAAIDVIDAAQIRDTQPRVNASEALATVPGLVARDRQNYAQDLQISSRGFGARSAFGVRGVRLIADGIPATMPDGQGQAATFNLDMAERIEVLRGPFSALYGNHSGGVVQLFTRNPKGPPAIETSFSAGSYGMRKLDVNAQGEANGIGYLLDASRFDIDGFRDHGAARRDQAYAKLTVATSPTSRLVMTASGLRQDDTQDPLGVSWATYQRDPRAGEIDTRDTVFPQRTLAERYNTRKSIDHKQAGLTWEQRFGANRLQVTAYGGNRRVVQYLAIWRDFQAPPTHSGGVVDFDRDFLGLDLNWRDVREFAGGTLRTTVGIDASRSTDSRQGFENFVGDADVFGVRGRLRRDEEDKVSNLDPYLQAEWERDAWVVTAGLRHNRVKFEVADHYLANGNDSGAVRYSHTTPLVGLLYKVSPTLNVYASAARGFETPTLNEVFYSGLRGGFNFNLKPATSTHLEAGVKALVGSNLRVNAALFQVRTQDELVVDVNSQGRTSYRNASATLRQGGELSLDAELGAGWNAKLALSALRAVYDEGFGTVPKGSRLPGVPKTSVYGEVGWKEAGGRYGAALETITNGRVFVEDTNTAQAAPGYAIFNARAQARQEWGRWTIKEFVRLNNLFDKQYVGSVIVGDGNGRFYEGAPGRNWVLGVSGQYQF